MHSNYSDTEFIHWQKLTHEQRQAIISTIKAGDPVRIFSEVLGEVVYWVRDDRAVGKLKGQGIREVCYTLAELKQIAGQGPEFLKDIHRLKREFTATLQRAEPLHKDPTPLPPSHGVPAEDGLSDSWTFRFEDGGQANLITAGVPISRDEALSRAAKKYPGKEIKAIEPTYEKRTAK